MDIRKQLLKEYSQANKQKIVKYIGSDQDAFNELINLFYGGEYRVIQRASSIMSFCIEENPFLIKPHLKKLISHLNKSTDDAVKRNIIRLLQFIEIPNNLLGITADICFRLLTSKQQAIAVKVFSMTVLFNISKQEPDLKQELIIAIEDQIHFESAAFKSRGSKILSKLKSSRTQKNLTHEP